MESAPPNYPSCSTHPPVSVHFVGPPMLSDLHSLCPVCGDLKIKVYKEMCRRASEGCPGCSLLRTVVSKLVGEDLEHGIQTLEVLLPVGVRVEENRPLILRLIMTDGAERNIELFRQQASSESERPHHGPAACAARGWLPPIAVARSVSNHSASAECLGLARQWLNNCLENHTECPGHEQVNLPTRVLYVGADSITSGPQLVITNGTQKGSYIALSHRWGVDRPMRLTAKTINVWQHGIPFEALPQTFRDAVAITRALGIDYLWVDSLCILQDSQEDWASESGKMADTYNNAILAIAADQSAGCNGGIFAARPKDEAEVLTLKLSTSCPGCSDCTFFARWQRSRSYPFINHSVVHGTAAPTSGLHSRGWTLQERLLSRRMLHFTSSELAWECTKEVACECRPQGTVPGQYLVFRRAFVNPLPVARAITEQEQLAAALKEIHGPLFHEGGGDLSNIVQLHWWLVVFEFTARSLTVETDRLTALAGIADLLCRRSVQEYYFGVLSDHAVRGLLWRNRRNTNRRRPSRRLPTEYAPSWSFGSITGRVGAVPNPERFTLLQPAVKVHSIVRRRLLSEANPYGPGIGTVDIEGCMVRVRVGLPVESGYSSKKHATATKEGRVLFTVADDNGLLHTNPPKPIPRRNAPPWGYFEPDVDGYEEEVDETVSAYLLTMGWIANGRQEQTVGLILVESPVDGDYGQNDGIGRACFRRVGIFVGGVGFGEPKMSKWAHFGANRRVHLL
ncbi:heterokaryon incompatibility protein-domain-containing protein [Apodospora peruviana]|uniref:Heterokaryon incompatibility protein-domain-containing protein n=1 Tax=Apodospora peruviana TaxID=516989 RepID=A0AAE0HXT6_9PEZI|nr:heterokaryon incompatibility protein-domain-containing protein [Apodospora peruviana]